MKHIQMHARREGTTIKISVHISLISLSLLTRHTGHYRRASHFQRWFTFQLSIVSIHTAFISISNIHSRLISRVFIFYLPHISVSFFLSLSDAAHVCIVGFHEMKRERKTGLQQIFIFIFREVSSAEPQRKKRTLSYKRCVISSQPICFGEEEITKRIRMKREETNLAFVRAVA